MRSILTVSVLIALSSASLAFAQLPEPTPIPTPEPTPIPTPEPTPLPTPPPLPDPITVTLSISGNEAQGSFEFATGIGADLTIAFENAVGLVPPVPTVPPTPAALEVTASLVDPLDLDLLGRLGPGVGIPVSFPVLIRISPSSTSALSFSGPYRISIHTHNLALDPNLPLSLFKAPAGAAFKDITKWEGRGSYRDDGSGGDFSDFITGVDLRQIDGVIVGKFDDLQTTLTDNAPSMAPAAVAALQESLLRARALYNDGDTRKAIREMRDFSRYVKKHGGEEIPDVWRANCSPVVNVAGLLRSGADTLSFSLDRKPSH